MTSSLGTQQPEREFVEDAAGGADALVVLTSRQHGIAGNGNSASAMTRLA